LFSVYFSFAIFILLLIILYFNYYFNLNWIDGELVSNSNFILFSIATVSLILHGLLRGIYLTINQGVGFAFYSILPAITILGCVGFGIIFEYSNLQELVLISAVLVLFFSVYIVIKINKLNDDFSIYKIPIKELFNHGTHSFLQALFYSAQPLFAFWAIKHYNGGYQDVGYFNIGLFFLQGFLVPVTMLSPYLFEYFTKNSSTNIVKIIAKNKFYFYDLILAIFLYFSVGVIDSFFFDSEYVIPIKLIQIILFSLPFNIHFRIFLPYIHAKGLPKYNTLFCFVRLLLFVLLSFLFIYFKFNVLVSLAICWSFSEIIVFLWIIISIKKIIIYDSL
jgi:O-antigen/teichoic acid export membrane protein